MKEGGGRVGENSSLPVATESYTEGEVTLGLVAPLEHEAITTGRHQTC